MLSTESDEVIGCVYIYPPQGQRRDGGTEGRSAAAVMSWVRADRAHLDRVLYDAVVAWLKRAWPFGSIQYSPRG